MSRAFVREDRDDDLPRHHFSLPSRRSPSYRAAAALLLLEAARDGILLEAEKETGLEWGDPRFCEQVLRTLEAELARPELEQDRRLIQVARRYLREAGNKTT